MAKSYHGKRFFDVVVSFALLVLLCPLLLVLSVLVARRVGRPVLYRQVRPGLMGMPFTILKFRSMTDPSIESGGDSDDARLTPFGRWLRATSLDELPELINVLRGDMSLVGPRPLLMHYLPLYTPEQARRHEARPGITGLAQVSGRNAIAWERRFALDVWYVDRMSFWLDLRIIGLTAWKILTREGISAPGVETMSEFRGTTRISD